MHQEQSGLGLLLAQLDKWRHFAAYKLEQRVDILFGMFLPAILEARFGIPWIWAGTAAVPIRAPTPLTVKP